MSKSRTIMVILFSLCLVSISNATNIIYVDVNGPNDPGTGTFADPFRRIQDAIDTAIDGDIIEIQPGLYTGEDNYDLDPNGLAIIIRSTDPNDPNVVANTIIDPNGAGRGFNFHSGEDANCTVSGLTITNGLAAGDSGGAILCSNNSSPTISNCLIKNNAADWYGGAVYCFSGSPTITGCTLSGNSAREGGALECWSGTCTIQNCVISSNIATDYGGGINCYYDGQFDLDNCTVIKNSASLGGGLRCVDDGKVRIRNSIFWSNNASTGAQIAVEFSPSFISEVTVGYSDVEGGDGGVYVDPEPNAILNWGSGNIDTDPCFASFDGSGDPNMWDFHLQSAYGRWDPNSKSWVSDSNTSLCIDAGDPNSDWTGELWPHGQRINMGAFGGTNQASMNGNPADFDISGAVNLIDLDKFSDKWLAQEFCIEDLNRHGVVEFAVFRIFAENWGWQRE